jgi:hypothetical protein
LSAVRHLGLKRNVAFGVLQPVGLPRRLAVDLQRRLGAFDGQSPRRASSGTSRTMYSSPRTGPAVRPMTRVSGSGSSRKSPGT